jgi:hypothetical protein
MQNDELRSSEQNRLMWALLTDIANHLEWPVDGKMQKLTPDDWKHILSAGLKRDQRVAAGIDGGFVILGQYTHKMTKAEMAEFIDFVAAFGTEKNIAWTEQSDNKMSALTAWAKG